MVLAPVAEVVHRAPRRALVHPVCARALASSPAATSSLANSDAALQLIRSHARSGLGTITPGSARAWLRTVLRPAPPPIGRSRKPVSRPSPVIRASPSSIPGASAGGDRRARLATAPLRLRHAALTCTDACGSPSARNRCATSASTSAAEPSPSRLVTLCNEPPDLTYKSINGVVGLWFPISGRLISAHRRGGRSLMSFTASQSSTLFLRLNASRGARVLNSLSAPDRLPRGPWRGG